MEHEYIFLKDGIAYPVYVVTSDLANGRYQIFSAALNNVHHGIYNTVEECHERFDMWVDAGRIDAWAIKWHVGMPSIYE